MAKEFWLVWKLLGDKSWGACEVFETIEQAFAYFERFGYVKTGKHSSDGALDGHSFDLYVTNDGEPEWMLQQLRGWRE